MAIRLTRPSSVALAELRAAGRSASLTYAPVGLSSTATAPAGYRLDRWTREIGSGDSVFDAAVGALFRWDVHRGAGLVVCADGPAELGMVVALAAPLPIGFIEVVCRVVDVATGPDRVGFTYGTLPVHPEQGEESFSVARSGDGVVFEIVACSRPRHPLARACPPAARALQRATTSRYLDAMQFAITTDPRA
jgi:uncharacterized protein (UPF0548 family)